MPARADEEDVAKLDGGALRGEAGLQVREGDGRGLEAGEGLDLGVWVGGPPGCQVDEDAATYDPLFGEGCFYICESLSLSSVLMLRVDKMHVLSTHSHIFITIIHTCTHLESRSRSSSSRCSPCR